VQASELLDQCLEIPGDRLTRDVLHLAVDNERRLDRAAADVDGEELATWQA
jgi:hypothetical protein